MIQANVHQAKTQLSKLIERAEAGEEVVIARNGKPAVRLKPIETSNPKTGWIGMFDGEMAHVPTWEEWQESDREMAAMWEDWLNAPEPEPIEHQPLSREELERIAKLSLEDLLAELVVKP